MHVLKGSWDALEKALIYASVELVQPCDEAIVGCWTCAEASRAAVERDAVQRLPGEELRDMGRQRQEVFICELLAKELVA
eukprot:CAMPEP_0206035174 /NCGR_PEP_ID=MMETSP1466-20131121/1893_1 /ASSEMBLY_ACC=CAM_ASM_001126 /TAXON_ID=44452 /ORGANISM="Pavlova gyrans, Strain CCMP608" /LENGTH=79 /DNA_ID=CAMNT_0053409525 /DNA_START=471 /DNA_END=710 /DNA_ORIENTATION=-